MDVKSRAIESISSGNELFARESEELKELIHYVMKIYEICTVKNGMDWNMGFWPQSQYWDR